MKGNTIILAVLAFVVVALTTPFQLFDIPLAPIAALIVGAVAGWMVVGTRSAESGSAGAKAGAAVGVGALLGSIVGLAVLALWFGNIPEVQTFVQNSEPNPEARIPTDWIAPLGALAGVIVGFLAGLFDLVVAAIAGWIAGALHTRNPQTQA